MSPPVRESEIEQHTLSAAVPPDLNAPRASYDARMQLLAHIGELVRLATDPDELMFGVAQTMGEALGAQRCFLAEIDHAHDRGIVRRDYHHGVPSLMGELRLSTLSDETGREMDAGHTVVVQDTQHDPRTAAWFERAYKRMDCYAYVGVPLLRDGQHAATFWISTNVRREWSAEEVALLETAAERAWFAVEKMRLHKDIRDERELLQKIFDNIPVMLTRYRPNKQVLQVNPEFERVTGWTTADAQQIDIMAACYPDPTYREEVRQFMDSGQDGWQDIRMTTRDGRVVETIWANVRLSSDSLVGIGLDISQRKRAEEALRLARDLSERTAERIARLQRVTAQLTATLTPAQVVEVISKDGMMALDATGMSVKLLSDNGLWLENIEAFGVAPQLGPAYRRYSILADTPVAEAVRSGQPVWLRSRAELAERYPHLVAEMAAQNFEAVCAVPLTLGNRVAGGIGVNFRHIVDFNAEEREFILTLARQCAQALERARLYEAEQRARLDLEARVAERTHELQQASVELRELARHLQTSREDERAAIARELHDDLGQILAVAKIDAAQLAKHIAADPSLQRFPAAQAVGQLETIQNSIEDGVRAIRTLVANLRPQVLDDLGLAAAIEWQVQQFQERTGIESQFTTNIEELDWDREREMALFRIVQESLANVAKHAQATRVDVLLREEAGALALEVRDNGRGIQPADAHKTNHFGILGMRERAILLGGGIEIEGVPGGGTRVAVRVPR